MSVSLFDIVIDGVALAVFGATLGLYYCLLQGENITFFVVTAFYFAIIALLLTMTSLVLVEGKVKSRM